METVLILLAISSISLLFSDLSFKQKKANDKIGELENEIEKSKKETNKKDKKE